MKTKIKLLFRKQPLFHYILYFLISAGGILLDMLSKALAVKYLKGNGTFPIIRDVLHLTYVTNTGAAFGMLKDAPWVFMTISYIFMVVLPLVLISGQLPNKLYGVALSMVFSGTVGNMIERIGKGYVVDFIDFRLIDFAVFNIADSLICVGAGLLALALIIDIVNESKQLKNENDSHT